MLYPRQPVPALSLPLLGGGRFDLAHDRGSWGTLVCFYRGLHCPVCAPYLSELDRLVPELDARGIAAIAISVDPEERAQAMAQKADLKALRLAYDLPPAQGRGWGLYLSRSRGANAAGLEEPAVFTEPGLFVVDAEGRLFLSSVQTMPTARPVIADVIAGLDFMRAKGFLPRGEIAADEAL
ncbi:AhpC/TSA family protein [Thioclava sp. BHET1]|nr:AhpC/TSA family protein [Thioclava sp. BHET1]